MFQRQSLKGSKLLKIFLFILIHPKLNSLLLLQHVPSHAEGLQSWWWIAFHQPPFSSSSSSHRDTCAGSKWRDAVELLAFVCSSPPPPFDEPSSHFKSVSSRFLIQKSPVSYMQPGPGIIHRMGSLGSFSFFFLILLTFSIFYHARRLRGQSEAAKGNGELLYSAQKLCLTLRFSSRASWGSSLRFCTIMVCLMGSNA